MARLVVVPALNVDDPITDAYVDALTGNVNYLTQPGADVASAQTIQVSSSWHRVTGTTTIDSITDPLGAVAGQEVRLLFAAGPITVRHQGGGTGNIRLAGGIHAGFVAGESCTLAYDGTNWVEVQRSPLHLTGQSIVWSGATVPPGYLPEDGSAVSRSSYAALFAVIGTTYGAGDGVNTFNLPDSRGRVDVGHAPSGGHADVSTIGASDGVAAAFRRPKHRTSSTLGINDPGHSHVIDTYGLGSGGTTGITQRIDLVSAYYWAGTAKWNTTGISLTGGVGTGVANDVADAPAYLVRPRLIRI